jgi:hypothetical protein
MISTNKNNIINYEKNLLHAIFIALVFFDNEHYGYGKCKHSNTRRNAFFQKVLSPGIWKQAKPLLLAVVRFTMTEVVVELIPVILRGLWCLNLRHRGPKSGLVLPHLM